MIILQILKYSKKMYFIFAWCKKIVLPLCRVRAVCADPCELRQDRKVATATG